MLGEYPRDITEVGVDLGSVWGYTVLYLAPTAGWCCHGHRWSTTKSRLIKDVGEPPVSEEMGNVGCGE